MNLLHAVRNVARKLSHYPSPVVERHLEIQPVFVATARPKRILICRPNHRLGNLLLITPIIQEVSRIFPDCEIDLFVKGELGQILFRNYPNVNRIIQLPKRPFMHLLNYIKGWFQITKNRYDIAINVDQSSSSGRLSVQFANSTLKVQGEVVEDLSRVHADYEHHAKFPVYNFWRHLETTEGIQRHNGMPPLDLKLDGSEIAGGKRILQELVGNEDTTICLYTFATGKKCYSKEWWVCFYNKLRNSFPDVNIIEILPLHKAAALGSLVPSFYSTDVREIGSVIANSALFIGADSGIMHLASSVHTPTVGLFSVTNQTRYAPYHNDSMSLDTNSVDVDGCLMAISLLFRQRTVKPIKNQEASVNSVEWMNRSILA
jgi:ADP-heptose:LPS heptosyltransferase